MLCMVESFLYEYGLSNISGAQTSIHLCMSNTKRYSNLQCAFRRQQHRFHQQTQTFPLNARIASRAWEPSEARRNRKPMWRWKFDRSVLSESVFLHDNGTYWVKSWVLYKTLNNKQCSCCFVKWVTENACRTRKRDCLYLFGFMITYPQCQSHKSVLWTANYRARLVLAIFYATRIEFVVMNDNEIRSLRIPFG